MRARRGMFSLVVLAGCVSLVFAESPKPDVPALAPDEAVRSIHVPEGFVLDLVAAEPQVIDPVAFDWDTRGRLWVVEMFDYPLGGEGGGRVRMLEDRDGDGRYETATLAADGLNFPNGILTWRDGVIVTAAPDILFLRDTDGDGRLDERTVLITGLGEGNQQLRANGLRWGLDNWAYVAAGGHHGKYGLDTKIRSTRTGKDVAIGSRDFRFRPDTGEIDPQSGPTQFGRNRDDFGRWFGTQNSNPLWHYVLDDHYLRRNPHVPAPDPRVQMFDRANPPVYHRTRSETRFHSFEHAGHYTSACSGMIYRGDQLPPREAVHAFVCEPTHSVVQHLVLEARGVSFTGRRVGGADEPDFFASNDPWCRPVMVRTGPDGGVWIADMYRYMIEHPAWLPEAGKAAMLPFYRVGDDRGRIYRVRRAGAVMRPVPDLEALDPAELVALLASPNGWIRDKAQQLLLWRGGDEATAALRELARDASRPLGRLHALCTLDGLGRLDAPLVADALTDAHPGVRENALRLAESRLRPPVEAAALKLVDDPAVRVQFQLALTLGEFPASPAAAGALATLLHRHADDPYFVTAALSSAVPHRTQLIAHLARDRHKPGARLVGPLVEMSLATGDTGAVATLLTPLLDRAAGELAPADLLDAGQMLDLLAHRKATGVIAAHDDLRGAHDRLIAACRQQMNSDNAPANRRLACAALLTRVAAHRAEALDHLLACIGHGTSPDDLARALAALAHGGDASIAQRLIERLNGLTPAARARVIDQLLGRAAWTKQLLAAIEAGTIPSSMLDATQRGRLLQHPDKSLRAIAAKSLGGDGASSRAQVIARYRPALELAGDAQRGAAVYARACAACHRHGDQGVALGPDMITVASHPPEKLLINIIDPNVDIQPGYHAYNCRLKSGEQLFGLLASESASSITMKLPDGSPRVILRSDIADLHSTGVSLMPPGLEAAITLQEMSDLIAFINAKPEAKRDAPRAAGSKQ